jgi:ribosomal protein S11
MWKEYYRTKFKKRSKKKSTYKFNVEFSNNCDIISDSIKNNAGKAILLLNPSLKTNSLIKSCKLLFSNYLSFEQKLSSSKLPEIILKYIKSFINVVVSLESIKAKLYQSCFLFFQNNFSKNQEFFVFYIIYLNYTSSNTHLHVIDSSGKSKIFYSSGLVDIKGKQKIVRRLVLVRLFNLLSLLKLKFIKNSPVALHLKNVGSNKFLIIKKLKRKFFIKVIKMFELNAYNGCRKKKERRKRQRKKRRGG